MKKYYLHSPPVNSAFAYCLLPIALCLLLIVNCLLPIASSAQGTFRYEICPGTGPIPRWDTELGLISHQVPSDSGYIVFGSASREKAFPPNTPPDSLNWRCFTSAKLDKYGNIEWIKADQEISNLTHKDLSDGIPTSDSGFAMTGYKGISSGSSAYKTILIQKLKKGGNLTWCKEFKMNGHSYGLKIRQMPDGGFVVMGKTEDQIYRTSIYTGGETNNIFLLRLDKNGNRLWCNYYDAKTKGQEFPSSLELTNDGGFIVGGSTSNASFDRNTKLLDYKGFMMKIKGDGTIAWARRYGNNVEFYLDNKAFGYSDGFSEVQATKDGGFIAVGFTDYLDTTNPWGLHNNRGWVVKTDALGIIVWQRSYSMTPKKVEITSDGYVLLSFNKIVKITKTGDVEWSTRYDTPPYSGSNDFSEIADINPTLDNGFIMSTKSGELNYGEGGLKGITIRRGAIIMRTNHLGKFDNSCNYEGFESSWMDSFRADTLYEMSLTTVNKNTTQLDLLEKIITSPGTCPVICGISNKPVAPDYISASAACVNTDAQVTISAAWGSAYNVQYSHFKVNFGDPGSGPKNETTGSGFIPYVYHNYANEGTYTVTVTYYNTDYSASEMRYTTARVLPQATQKILTPEIHVCQKDTVVISAQILNYVDGLFDVRWNQESAYNNGNPTILSQTNTIKDNVLTTSITVATDPAEHYYTLFSFAGNCEMHDTIKILTGDNEALISGDAKICSGGSSELKACGGDAYLWSTGNTTESISISPKSNKTYWVEALTTDGCKDTAYFYVQVASTISLDILALPAKKICLGDTVMLIASGAQNYSWNMGTGNESSIEVIPALGQNTYNVTGTSGSCTATASIQISADSVPTGNFTLPTSVGCSGTYVLTASGADSYDWYGQGVTAYYDKAKNPVQTITASYDPTYVTMTKGACTTTREFALPYSIVSKIPLSPKIGGINVSECRVCPGTTVRLKKYFPQVAWYASDQNFSDNPENQGLSYHWSTGQTTTGSEDSIQVLVTRDTLITLTTTNQYGCSTVVSELIQAKPNFYIKKEAALLPSCGNSSTTLYLTGDPFSGISYTWLHNGSKEDTLIVSPLQDTMYYVSMTANGCTRTDSIWVKAKSNLPQATITGDSIVCKGGQATFMATGTMAPQNYKWLTGNVTDTQSSLTLQGISAASTLKAFVTFPGGCGDTAEYKISVTDVPHALISGDTLICPGNTSLKASGGNTYKWSTGELTSNIEVAALGETPVSLYAFAGNCSDTATVIIKTNKTIAAILFSDEDTTCTGTPVTLVASGGDHYSWNTGVQKELISMSAFGTATYTVTVTTDDNCKDSKSITIHVNPAPLAQISSASVCQGESLTLIASGGDSYLWGTGEVAPSLIIKNPITDKYYKVKVFVGSCADSADTKVSILPKPVVDAGADISINYGNNAPVFVTGSGAYQWSPAAGLSCTDCASPMAEPAQSTLYYITLKDANGCTATDSVMVFVDLPCGDLFVPDAFSPNNDGNNDVFFIRGRCIHEIEFKVFDRWGNKVFETNETYKGWDGTYNDKPMNPAIFVYSLEATLTGGEVVSRKGNVVLMK